MTFLAKTTCGFRNRFQDLTFNLFEPKIQLEIALKPQDRTIRDEKSIPKMSSLSIQLVETVSNQRLKHVSKQSILNGKKLKMTPS